MSETKQIGKRLLPVLSNQKMSQHLKEISELCHFNKRMTFHLSCYTFPATVTLSNGVLIEYIGKMQDINPYGLLRFMLRCLTIS
ncbi:hypothetical protein ACFSQJ_10905 [Croceitalea marina]|uniref:Uncharacterized protein n=2 Tax=Croceitalea marina TaxID=1775166 RepID=A0ABW5MWP8_9FLAO